jgi:hypothetical protein
MRAETFIINGAQNDLAQNQSSRLGALRAASPKESWI